MHTRVTIKTWILCILCIEDLLYCNQPAKAADPANPAISHTGHPGAPRHDGIPDTIHTNTITYMHVMTCHYYAAS